MTDAREFLCRARLSLSAAVNCSLDADVETDADGRSAKEHRQAAELRLRRAGQAELARRLAASDDPVSSDARAVMRQVMQLIDAELEETDGSGFELASDGGRQATERRDCVDCGGVMRVVPTSGIDRCVPCRQDGGSDD